MCRGTEYSEKYYFDLILKKKFDEAENYRQSFVPRKLYKFFWLDDDAVGDTAEQQRLQEKNQLRLNTLWNNCLWASHVDLLNDPYEFQCLYVDGERLRAAHYPEPFIELCKQMLGNAMKNLGVVCLSSVPPEKNVPMWAYYSNNSRGFCVEFDVLSSQQIHKISYESDRIPIASMLVEYANEAIIKGKGRGTPETEEIMRMYETIFVQQIYLKHLSWRHENEYRVAVPLHIGAKGANVSIESASLKVSRIIAGLACSDLHKGVLNNISNDLGCGDAYHVEMSDTSFISIVRR